jgi:hypothetical protein
MGAESRLLYDTHPMVVNPKLAKIIGLEEAIVLHQLHYWVNLNRDSKKNYRDGYYWTYNTFKKWHKEFEFWSISTIKRIIKKLEDKQLIIVGRFNKVNIDRTKWYRVNHNKLIELESPLVQIDTLESPNMDFREVQTDTIDEATDSVNLTQPIPETNKQRLNTENSFSEKKHAPKLHSRWIFAEMQKELGYPDKTDKDPIPNYGKEAKAIKRMLFRNFTEEDILAAWLTKVRSRGEFVSMTWVNEDIGKTGKQTAFALPDQEDLVESARERGLIE